MFPEKTKIRTNSNQMISRSSKCQFPSSQKEASNEKQIITSLNPSDQQNPKMPCF